MCGSLYPQRKSASTDEIDSPLKKVRVIAATKPTAKRQKKASADDETPRPKKESVAKGTPRSQSGIKGKARPTKASPVDETAPSSSKASIDDKTSKPPKVTRKGAKKQERADVIPTVTYPSNLGYTNGEEVCMLSMYCMHMVFGGSYYHQCSSLIIYFRVPRSGQQRNPF